MMCARSPVLPLTPPSVRGLGVDTGGSLVLRVSLQRSVEISSWTVGNRAPTPSARSPRRCSGRPDSAQRVTACHAEYVGKYFSDYGESSGEAQEPPELPLNYYERMAFAAKPDPYDITWLPPGTTSATEHVPRGVDEQDLTAAIHERALLPADFLAEKAVDLGKSGAQTILWHVCDLASYHVGLGPLGPVVLRCLYLTGQLLDALTGLNTGEGVVFSVSVPGIENHLLPKFFELNISLSIASERDGLKPHLATAVEMQVFKPFFPNYDLGGGEHGRVPGRISPAWTPTPSNQDPWRVWLALLGDGLIRDLARTLATWCQGLSPEDIHKALREARTPQETLPLRNDPK